jgi:hypothetical protein
MEETSIEVNDIVQINENGKEGWVGCLVQVDEVKNFGIQGFVRMPLQGDAYIRLNFDQFEKVGKAILMPMSCI